MLEHLINVRIISAGHRVSWPKETIANRKYHALFYKDQGKTLYRIKDRKIILDTDSVVYLPKGSSYYYEDYGDLEGKIFYVTFDCDPEIPIELSTFPLKNPGEIRKLFVKTFRAFRFGGSAGKLDAYSAFYKLLSVLERNMEYSEDKAVGIDRIEPAVRYLQEHLFDADLRISNLHKLCGVSAPTFRGLFETAYGCTPKNYVLHQRMQCASELLRSEEYNTVASVAASVGFEDQLYFSKCFKVFYGVSPSVYRK